MKMFQKKLVRYPLIATLILLLGFFLGFRFDHPHSGLKNALGSATSSIALYRSTTSFNSGDIVLVNTGAKDLDPALARISNVTKDGVDIQSGPQIQRVDAKAVKGKLLVIIPFIGTIFSTVGL
jgi:hypothetical protein